MQIHLAGHLDYYSPQKRNTITIPLSHPTSLDDLLEGLAIPPAEVALCAVNGTAVFPLEEVIVQDEDSVALYPHVGGG